MNPPAPFASAMHEALALAQHAIGLSEPNPRVGCVITSADGRVIGRGHTQQAGGAHAEVMALRDVLAHGESARGATAHVTLEPCAHHGRTPPCCEALIEAGIARVVMAVQDPNPFVAGQGAAWLRSAGIVVDEGELASESHALNIGFFSRMQRGRPWLRMKAAITLDGRSALDNGVSQWITGEAARTDGHAFRKRAGALLTGVGTVLEDNPRLDVRLVETVVQPLRVVVDSRLQIDAGARVLQPPGRALVYCTSAADAERGSALTRNAPHIEVATLPADAHGKTDLAAMLADLARREVNELHVEAGHKLNGSLLAAGLVDELLIYLAPTMLGLGREMAAFGPLEKLADGLGFEFIDVERVGADLRIRARPPGRADF